MYKSPLNLSVVPAPAIKVDSISIDEIVELVTLGSSNALENVTAAPEETDEDNVVPKEIVFPLISKTNLFSIPGNTIKSPTSTPVFAVTSTLSLPIDDDEVVVVSKKSMNSKGSDLYDTFSPVLKKWVGILIKLFSKSKGLVASTLLEILASNRLSKIGIPLWNRSKFFLLLKSLESLNTLSPLLNLVLTKFIDWGPIEKYVNAAECSKTVISTSISCLGVYVKVVVSEVVALNSPKEFPVWTFPYSKIVDSISFFNKNTSASSTSLFVVSVTCTIKYPKLILGDNCKIFCAVGLSLAAIDT